MIVTLGSTRVMKLSTILNAALMLLYSLTKLQCISPVSVDLLTPVRNNTIEYAISENMANRMTAAFAFETVHHRVRFKGKMIAIHLSVVKAIT